MTTAIAAPAESEADFQTWVVELLQVHGWRVAHVRDARGQQLTGLPDIVAVHRDPPGLIFLELKSARGRLSKEQEEWMADLGVAMSVNRQRIIARVLRPTDRDWLEMRVKHYRQHRRFHPVAVMPELDGFIAASEAQG